MVDLSNYKNPFDAIVDFEGALSLYTGAPYVITTGCCTNAMELCIRYLNILHKNKLITKDNPIILPYKTYLSVLMLMRILDVKYIIKEYEWEGKYSLGAIPVWDCARNLEMGMYIADQLMCLSFGRTKPLEIGRGGAILTDNKDAYDWLIKARGDGRDLSISPWGDQKEFSLGYHYMMHPEECITGLNLLAQGGIPPVKMNEYPDIRNIKII